MYQYRTALREYLRAMLAAAESTIRVRPRPR